MCSHGPERCLCLYLPLSFFVYAGCEWIRCFFLRRGLTVLTSHPGVTCLPRWHLLFCRVGTFAPTSNLDLGLARGPGRRVYCVNSEFDECGCPSDVRPVRMPRASGLPGALHHLRRDLGCFEGGGQAVYVRLALISIHFDSISLWLARLPAQLGPSRVERPAVTRTHRVGCQMHVVWQSIGLQACMPCHPQILVLPP